jgi:hypothetical protein
LGNLDPCEVGEGEDPHVVQGGGSVYALSTVHVDLVGCRSGCDDGAGRDAGGG